MKAHKALGLVLIGVAVALALGGWVTVATMAGGLAAAVLSNE